MASALSSTAWTASSTSWLVMARMASRSLASSRSRMWRSVAAMSVLLLFGEVEGFGLLGEGADEALDQVGPGRLVGEIEVEGLEAEEDEAEGGEEEERG